MAEPDAENGTHGHGVLSRISYPADRIDVAVDAELGIALMLAWSWQGHALFTTELRDVSELAAGATFQYQPPAGMRVINSSNPLAAITAKEQPNPPSRQRSCSPTSLSALLGGGREGSSVVG